MVLAKEFQSGCRANIRRLMDLEEVLKTQGPVADDIMSIRNQIDEFQAFQKELNQEEINVNTCLKKGEVILRFCHPNALQTTRYQINILKRRWFDVSGWAKQRDTRLKEQLELLLEEQRLLEILLMWITEQETTLMERETMPLPEDYNVLTELLDGHKLIQEEATTKQPDVDRVTKHAKRKPVPEKSRLPSYRTPGRPGSMQRSGSWVKEYLNPGVTQLVKRWQHLWLLLINRNRRLQDKLDEIRIKKASAEFNLNEWRDRYNAWLQEAKSRVLDMWRRKDTDRDNKLTKEQFAEAITETTFVTERWEVELIFEMYERAGFISYKDFMDALKRKVFKSDKPLTENEKIHNEIEAETKKCCCPRAFPVEKVAEGKYRFGDSQKLRLVRILRSTVTVRVGGGWESLGEFLMKNDPCRGMLSLNF